MAVASAMMFFMLIVLAAGAVVVLWAIGIYNGLVRRKNEVDNAWAQIDVQLKRRYDLIPNLVETVKGYAKHESGTLEKVVQARAMAMNAQGVADKAVAENMLSGALKSLFALGEAYPDLKANQNFLALQEELATTENKVGFARQYYNDSVMNYNTAIEQFPANLIANTFNFGRREFFEVKEEEVREAPKVQF
jgi:LemA protein